MRRIISVAAIVLMIAVVFSCKSAPPAEEKPAPADTPAATNAPAPSETNPPVNPVQSELPAPTPAPAPEPAPAPAPAPETGEAGENAKPAEKVEVIEDKAEPIEKEEIEVIPGEEAAPEKSSDWRTDAKAKEMEDAFWARIVKNAENRIEAGNKPGAITAYKNYLRESPDGPYVEDAKRRIAELEQK